MKIAIVIPTYYRKDGNTSKYLTRALDSVFNQTYQNFKIFLMGDKYENEIEVLEILKKYDGKKIFFTNLLEAKERDNYLIPRAIWLYGGVNATNIGIEMALNEGYEYICHLDHDDWWSNDHLDEISKCINETNSNWICTKSTRLSPNNYLPNILTKKKYNEFLPSSSSLIHSSVCMNFKEIPLRYRDLYLETGKVGLPADADLWERTKEFLTSNSQTGIFIDKLTCYHEEEGFSKTINFYS